MGLILVKVSKQEYAPYLASANILIMLPEASVGPAQPTYATDSAQLPALLQQLVLDLANPIISYLLVGHYYDRTNHLQKRHFPAVFALQQGEVYNVEIGSGFVSFDTEIITPPKADKPLYYRPVDSFRATVHFDQLYQLCRKLLSPTEQATEEVSYGLDTILYYNEATYKNCPTLADIKQVQIAASL
jgi:hypothetical protein